MTQTIISILLTAMLISLFDKKYNLRAKGVMVVFIISILLLFVIYAMLQILRLFFGF